ncbi:CCHC-type domain-containing protein [Pycnococcus provasolii]
MPAANITNGLNVADLSKFETSTTTGILKLIDGEKQYDGSSTTYSAWFEAVSSKLKGLGLTTFTSDVKGTTIDAYSNAQWNQSYSVGDRQFIYNVINGTLTEKARLLGKREDSNGVLLVRKFVKQWATPSLANVIANFHELANLHAQGREDPSSIIERAESIVDNFFGDTDTLKTALLCRILKGHRYKSVIDNATLQGIPEYVELKDNIMSYWQRQIKTHGEPSKEKSSDDEVHKAAARAAAIALAAKDVGTQQLNRRTFCKTCNQHVTDHTTSTCPYGNGNGSGGRGGRGYGGRGRGGRGRGQYGRGASGRYGGRNGAGGRGGGRSGQREQEFGKRDRDESQQKCYICGKYGHISYNCPENDKSTKSMQGGYGKGRKSTVEFDDQE